MINYETILSTYDDKLTLMQWLKKVEAALKDASAVSFQVNNRGNATLTFSVVFEDGSELESDPIILQQGESVTGAHMDAGHLILTLSNGDELDAGNLGAVSGMFINSSQHLIVAYQDGTTQDLGAIFTGNVNINGNFTANSIIENMSGYSYSNAYLDSRVVLNYVGACKNGNKITFVIAGKIEATSEIAQYTSLNLGEFIVPSSIGAYIIPNYDNDKVGPNRQFLGINSGSGVDVMNYLRKWSNQSFNAYIGATQALPAGTYYFRFEYTLLLSPNLAA